MMTSSNGNIFRVTGHLCGEFTGPRWIPRTKASDAELWCFSLICVRINCWVNNREAGDLRRPLWRHMMRKAFPCYDVVIFILFTGVHTVANIGREGVEFESCIEGSLISLLLMLRGWNKLIYSAVFCACYVNYNCKTWKLTRPKHRSVRSRILVLSVCCLLYSALLANAIDITRVTHITTSGGNQVRWRHCDVSLLWMCHGNGLTRLTPHKRQRNISMLMDFFHALLSFTAIWYHWCGLVPVDHYSDVIMSAMAS